VVELEEGAEVLWVVLGVAEGRFGRGARPGRRRTALLAAGGPARRGKRQQHLYGWPESEARLHPLDA
jgi:hypothetical protein